jgi:beta-lactamase superfamily II metal-dependent hydrolase
MSRMLTHHDNDHDHNVDTVWDRRVYLRAQKYSGKRPGDEIKTPSAASSSDSDDDSTSTQRNATQRNATVAFFQLSPEPQHCSTLVYRITDHSTVLLDLVYDITEAKQRSAAVASRDQPFIKLQ